MWFQKQRAKFRCYSLNPCVGSLPCYAVSATARVGRWFCRLSAPIPRSHSTSTRRVSTMPARRQSPTATLASSTPARGPSHHRLFLLSPVLHIATGLWPSQCCLANLWPCLRPFASKLTHRTALPCLSAQVCRRRSRQDLLPQGQRGDAGADGPRPLLLLEGCRP